MERVTWIVGPLDCHRTALEIIQAFLCAKRMTGFDSIFVFDDFSTELAAFLGENITLTSPFFFTYEDACTINRKNRFRLACQEAKVASPLFVALSEEDLTDWEIIKNKLSALPFPFILKPSRGAGSYIIRRCSGWSDVQAMLSAYHYEKNNGLVMVKPSGVLAEQILSGLEVDADLVVCHGRVAYCSIADNHAASPPYFLEEGGNCPSTLPAPTRAALQALAQQVVFHMQCIDSPHAINSHALFASLAYISRTFKVAIFGDRLSGEIVRSSDFEAINVRRHEKCLHILIYLCLRTRTYPCSHTCRCAYACGCVCVQATSTIVLRVCRHIPLRSHLRSPSGC